MGEQAILADWRVRAASQVGAVLACALLAALLLSVSGSVITPERPALGVAVLIERETPPERQTAQPRSRALGAPTPSNAAPPASPSVDATMGAQLLRCVVRPDQPRPADCPREAEPEDWRRPSLPVGGRYAPPPEPNMEQIYTRAERETLVMPSCVRDKTSGACIRFGQRPPPPSRSAEQLCQEGGLGGPCAPPQDQP